MNKHAGSAAGAIGVFLVTLAVAALAMLAITSFPGAVTGDEGLFTHTAPANDSTADAALAAASASANPPAGITSLMEGLGLVVGLVVGGLVVGVIVAVGVTKGRAHRRARLGAKAARLAHAADTASRLSRAHALHAEVAAAYASFESDLLAVLRTPLLSDITVPTTAAFITSLTRATSAEPETDTPSEAALLRFEDAVTELSTSWATAKAYATKTGVRTLAPEHVKLLNRARDLIDLALSPAASPAERALAHERALKLLEGIVLVPERARAALETSSRLALTSTPTPAETFTDVARPQARRRDRHAKARA